MGRVHITRSQIQEALGCLARGGVILFPTDTVYGLGCKSSDRAAMKRIFTLKGRPSNQPLQLLLSAPEEAKKWAARVPGVAQELMDRYWPGGLTILLPAAEGLPRQLTGSEGKVGLRVPKFPDLQDLISLAGGALAATSANLSGHRSPWSVEEIPSEIRSGVDYAIDGGRLEAVPASTVIDCTLEQPLQRRAGAIDGKALERFGVKL